MNNSSLENSNEIMELLKEILEGITYVMNGKILSAAENMKIYKKIYIYCTETEKSNTAQISDEDFNSQGIYGQILFDKIEDLLETHFCNVQKRISEGFYPLINVYMDEWNSCLKSARIINSICSYLNRNWVRQQRTQTQNKVCGFFHLAIVKWTKKVFYSFHIRLIDEALSIIHKNRCGETVDMFILKDFCEHMQVLSQDHIEPRISERSFEPGIIYKSEFHSRFLHMTENYYIAFSREKFEQLSSTEYLKALKIALDAEIDRAINYISPQIIDDIRKLIEDICIAPHLVSLYASFKQLLIDESSEEINFFYNIIRNIPNVVTKLKTTFLDEFKSILSNHIDTLGQSKNDPYIIVNIIFEIFRKYDKFVSIAFDEDPAFEENKTQAYSHLLNNCFGKNDLNSIHETLARYLHIVMTTKHDLAQIFRSHGSFTEYMRCLELIRDKDGFKKCYKDLLALRLIYNTSLCHKTEVEVIQYFTSIKDEEFSIHLKKMLFDVDSFGLVNEEFSRCIRQLVVIKPYFISIFKDVWPVNFVSECIPPTEISSIYISYEKFYYRRFKSREIKFYENLSQVVLEIPFSSGIYNVSMDGFHASIILLFRFSHAISFNEIMDATKIQYSTLRSVMESLLRSELIICNYQSPGYKFDILPDTHFKLNNYFDSFSKFICVDLINNNNEVSVPKVSNYSEHTQCSDLTIQACIVRNLKRDRQINAATLVSRVMKILNAFNIQEEDVRKNIENLVAREFLYYNREIDSFIYIE